MQCLADRFPEFNADIGMNKRMFTIVTLLSLTSITGASKVTTIDSQATSQQQKKTRTMLSNLPKAKFYYSSHIKKISKKSPSISWPKRF